MAKIKITTEFAKEIFAFGKGYIIHIDGYKLEYWQRDRYRIIPDKIAFILTKDDKKRFDVLEWDNSLMVDFVKTDISHVTQPPIILKDTAKMSKDALLDYAGELGIQGSMKYHDKKSKIKNDIDEYIKEHYPKK